MEQIRRHGLYRNEFDTPRMPAHGIPTMRGWQNPFLNKSQYQF